MPVLAAIQALIATGFLLAGLITLFEIGVTGLLFLVPALVFAATAGINEKGSKLAVSIALVADAVLAYFAWTKVYEFFVPDGLIERFGQQAAAAMKRKPVELVIPVLALFLAGLAVAAAVRDWRNIRAAPWF